MDNDTLELAIKKINDLEKKLEIYYHLLHLENELDFILNGTYLYDSEIQDILSGEY